MNTELRAGPHNPVTTTPRAAADSNRRAYNIDITFPDGLLGRVVADVRGRDFHAGTDGALDVVDELAVVLDIDPTTSAVVEAGEHDALRGLEVRKEYTRALTDRFPSEAERRSLWFSALEDLGGAFLVSGYLLLLEGLIAQTQESADFAADRQADLCAGWAADGPFIERTRTLGRVPVPIGPPAPDIDSDYEMAPLASPTLRRRRRIDVLPRRTQEHFRDTYAGLDGEMVLHEYLVDAMFDDDGRLASIDVDPRVLPWHECPGAAASAQRLVGVELGELAIQVRRDLVGVTTCTHLNSTLRAIADVRSLGVLPQG
jgi:hypothetical protein